jgi:hypothetical protein
VVRPFWHDAQDRHAVGRRKNTMKVNVSFLLIPLLLLFGKRAG